MFGVLVMDWTADNEDSIPRVCIKTKKKEDKRKSWAPERQADLREPHGDLVENYPVRTFWEGKKKYLSKGIIIPLTSLAWLKVN